ncbi:EAL domain-containing protein [Alkalimarinus alittae]|uniref:EAL domain-containing protein n=1 Tax=Alkalimarinus alittae TaxID=2961619 RepID=A0ABY6N428_9ALTE|nr:EAL domain-containing protein [Alkalimarinus alittae]UZE96883.1 EAL domain-containing protein [Alkalimarinus alittae]
MVAFIRFKMLAIVLLFFSVFVSHAYAENSTEHKKVLSFDQAMLEQALGPYIEYIEDPQGELTIADILQQTPQTWSENKQGTPNFGYSSSTYWFRISLHNISQNETLSRFLVVDYPLLDRLEYFRVKNGQVIDQYLTGDKLPFNQRLIEHRSFIFPLNFSANEQSDIYFRVNSGGAVQVPLTIWEPQHYFINDQTELVRKSVFYGVLSVMVLFNLFIFFSLREAPYFYYVMFVFSFLVTQVAMHGVTYQYLWPSYPVVQEMAILLAVPGCVLFTSLFSRSFLSLAKYAPRFDLFFKITAFLGLLNILSAFFLPYRLLTTTAVFLVALVCIACIFVGPYLWFKGHKIARFFTIAWMCMVVTTTLLALNKFGIIPYNYLTENGLLLGSSLEAVLLSFALADRLNREREERWDAQRQMLAEIRQRHDIEESILYDATHNQLTGLPNRVFIENRFSELMAGEGFEQEGLALILVHFDRFHEVNKTLGHLRADQLLKSVCLKISARAQELTGIVDVENNGQQSLGVAFIEGVSIAVLIDKQKNKDITDTAEALLDVLSTPIEYEGMAIDVGASIGISHYPQHGADVDALLSHSMIAVDVGVHRGERVTEYSDDINPYNSRRLTLMGDLQNAVNNDLLELYFQPQVNCKQNKVAGFEALLRWNHPLYGFIPPDEFIPIAEKTGTINVVTEWVLDKALSSIAALNNSHHQMTVSVNISAVNLKQKQFLLLVQTLLNKYQVSPQLLILEITETAMMEDPENALLVLTALNQIGVKLSIDDFGTGHSSLSYIKQLPVHEIKIDRSFVMEMDSDKDDAIIVKTTVNMCHDLGYEVVAEGVETLTSLDTLKAMGCDYLQGYYLARPLPMSELLVWLHKQHPEGYRLVSG